MDRREYPRPTMIGRVELQLFRPPEREAGYVINISRGGIGIYFSKSLEINTELLITVLFLNDGKEVGETVSGLVRWNRTIGDLYAIGIQFRGLHPEKHPLIVNYLDTAISD